jgi:hypothetical protein
MTVISLELPEVLSVKERFAIILRISATLREQMGLTPNHIAERLTSRISVRRLSRPEVPDPICSARRCMARVSGKILTFGMTAETKTIEGGVELYRLPACMPRCSSTKSHFHDRLFLLLVLSDDISLTSNTFSIISTNICAAVCRAVPPRRLQLPICTIAQTFNCSEALTELHFDMMAADLDRVLCRFCSPAFLKCGCQHADVACDYGVIMIVYIVYIQVSPIMTPRSLGLAENLYFRNMIDSTPNVMYRDMFENRDIRSLMSECEVNPAVAGNQMHV